MVNLPHLPPPLCSPLRCSYDGDVNERSTPLLCATQPIAPLDAARETLPSPFPFAVTAPPSPSPPVPSSIDSHQLTGKWSTSAVPPTAV